MRSCSLFWLRFVLAVMLGGLLSASAGQRAAAQGAEQFYTGKTLYVLIGYGVGGSDDLWARLIAKYLPAKLPGHPNVVPQNVPGAGSLLVANQIYNTSPKDGTFMGLFNRGVPFEPLLGNQATKFDPAKFNYLGSPDRDTTVCAVRKDAAVKSLADLKTTTLTVGGTGSGADSETYPRFLANVFGLKIDLVSGYAGSRDIGLATERGEVQGLCVSYDTILRSSGYRSGLLSILFQTGIDKDPRMPEVPLVLDAAPTQDARAAAALFLSRVSVGRPFAMPPQVPQDRVEAVRAAFAAVLDDPAFVAEAEKSDLHVAPISPAEITATVAQAYKTAPAIVDMVKKGLGRNS